jgi:hypothetical protein
MCEYIFNKAFSTEIVFSIANSALQNYNRLPSQIMNEVTITLVPGRLVNKLSILHVITFADHRIHQCFIGN